MCKKRSLQALGNGHSPAVARVATRSQSTMHSTLHRRQSVDGFKAHPQFWIFMSSITVPMRDVSTSFPRYMTEVGLSWPSTQIHLSTKESSSSMSFSHPSIVNPYSIAQKKSIDNEGVNEGCSGEGSGESSRNLGVCEVLKGLDYPARTRGKIY